MSTDVDTPVAAVDEHEPLVLPEYLRDADTPGVRKPLSLRDLMTANMGHLDDDELLALATGMRDDARAEYEKLAGWVRVIRARRALARKSERAVALSSGVSRAAIRKATTAAKKK